MFKKINLKKPSEKLISITKDIADKCPINIDSVNWHKLQQPKQTNVVSGSFVMREDLTSIVEQEYAKNFNHKLYASVGILENPLPESVACYPIHCDRKRYVALNYYVNLGGTDVQTLFYDAFADSDDKEGGHIIPYDTIKPIDNYNTLLDTWYCFNTRQYHSVENIETKRIMLSLILDLTFETLIKEYSTLISEV